MKALKITVYVLLALTILSGLTFFWRMNKMVSRIGDNQSKGVVPPMSKPNPTGEAGANEQNEFKGCPMPFGIPKSEYLTRECGGFSNEKEKQHCINKINTSCNF